MLISLGYGSSRVATIRPKSITIHPLKLADIPYTKDSYAIEA
jgi:hypothetical protein